MSGGRRLVGKSEISNRQTESQRHRSRYDDTSLLCEKANEERKETILSYIYTQKVYNTQKVAMKRNDYCMSI